MPSEDERTPIRLGVRQSIEELTGGRIVKKPREAMDIAERRGDEVDREDAIAYNAGYRPGMSAEEARARGIDERTFVSQEIEHHVEDLGMEQDRAVAAALDEARRGGYDVPAQARERGESESPR